MDEQFLTAFEEDTMRILIVDDLKSRVDSVALAIRNIDPTAEVKDTDKAVMAKQLLHSEHYDLVIIDIHIPYRTGENPEAKHGIDLIKYISKNDGIFQPGSVLGITSESDLLSDIRNECQSNNVFIVGYDDSSDSWLNIIEFSVNNIARETKNHKDLVIITTTKEEEKAILTSGIFNWSLNKRSIKNLTKYSEGTIEIGGNIHTVACVKLTRMGMIDSAIITATVINDFAPKIVIMTGICGGIPQRVNLGDVIIVTSSWDWQRGKYTEKNDSYSLNNELDQITLPDSMQRKISEWADIIQGSDTFKRLTSNSPTGDGVKIRVGSMVSGSSVISSSVKIKEIALQSRNLLGIDMEIFGFYSTMRSLENTPVKLIAVKSVCDLADEKKDDKYHSFCSNISSTVGIELAIKFLQDAQHDV